MGISALVAVDAADGPTAIRATGGGLSTGPCWTGPCWDVPVLLAPRRLESKTGRYEVVG
ncbi:hypothetical protein [Frankia sp. CcWB3]